MITVTCLHTATKEITENCPVADISDLRQDSQHVVWANVSDPTSQDFTDLAEEFDFHHLSIEDCRNAHQRPKVEEYPGYYFIVLYEASLVGPDDLLELRELNIFLGKNYLVTVHSRPIRAITTARRLWEEWLDRSEAGAGLLAYEDSAELQLQQPHVVRLETRPPNLEGEGEITMRDLVKNCLRMRPERIIVGEVRGPEAFDLLQAMNTGHDGSMGTLHSNSPREAISRLESMIMMGGYSLPVKTIREMITGSIDIIVQASRLRDGSRKITHITEVLGMEDETVTLQNLIVYEITGEDANGKLTGRHRSTGIARPRFWDRAEYYKETGRLAEALAGSEVLDKNGNPLGETNG